MKKILLMWLAAILLCSCSDPTSSKRALENAGYSNVKITGWSPLSCGRDDSFSTGFIATNPKGKRVKGVVCCGLLFKQCTIRF